MYKRQAVFNITTVSAAFFPSRKQNFTAARAVHLNPVSYTHLDVYKRQISGSLTAEIYGIEENSLQLSEVGNKFYQNLKHKYLMLYKL